MAGLIKLREEVHNSILRMRSIEAMLERPDFERLWDDSNNAQQDALRALVKKNDKDAVRNWIRNHPSLELAEKKLVELKKIACQLCIPNYSRKSKLELIRDIQAKEKMYGEKQSLHVG